MDTHADSVRYQSSLTPILRRYIGNIDATAPGSVSFLFKAKVHLAPHHFYSRLALALIIRPARNHLRPVVNRLNITLYAYAVATAVVELHW